MASVNSYNIVLLMGYVSTEPIFNRAIDRSTSLCRFDMATNEKFYNDKSKAEFHRVVTWGKRAEFCNKWLKKGRQIAVTGKLRHRSYNDDEGTKGKITEVMQMK